MTQRKEINLIFTRQRETKRTYLFSEEIGEEAWSDKDVAIGPLYIQKQALEVIGNPEQIEVTIKPHKR